MHVHSSVSLHSFKKNTNFNDKQKENSPAKSTRQTRGIVELTC